MLTLSRDNLKDITSTQTNETTTENYALPLNHAHSDTAEDLPFKACCILQTVKTQIKPLVYQKPEFVKSQTTAYTMFMLTTSQKTRIASPFHMLSQRGLLS